MKDLWKSGVLILLIIGVVYIIFLRECKPPLPCPAQDEMIIKKSTWDSIEALANKPPVVIIDTQYIQGPIVYLPGEPIPGPTPDPQDTTINHYSDSLIKDDVDVHIQFTVRGQLLTRNWAYRPIIREIRRDSLIYVPYVVEVEKPVSVVKNNLYGYVVFGGNENSFLFGGGLDWITKKDTQIGYMYQRFGDQNFHNIKLGTVLFRRSTK